MGINWNRCKPSSPMSTHSSARTGLFQKFLIAEPTMRTISRPSITAWEQRHCFSKRTSKSFRSHPMEIGWNLKSEKGVAWWQHPSELHSCGALGGTRTPNLLIRSQMLYPIELRAQGGHSNGWDTTYEIRIPILSPVALRLLGRRCRRVGGLTFTAVFAAIPSSHGVPG